MESYEVTATLERVRIEALHAARSDLSPGSPSGIEVKSARGRVTTEQQAFIDMVRELGGRAGVARSESEAVRIIEGKL